MERIFEKAMHIKEEIIAHRRWFHENAEVGLEMPKAVRYVTETLQAYGLSPQRCGHGVVTTIGTGGKTLLLRADMDALPMKEESGETFSCQSGTAAHACGHDMHAAMLLGAAKILKDEKLDGTVKFMFQPAEETFEGSQEMISEGVLDDVDAALAFRVAPGKMPPGLFMYNSKTVMMSSVDGFRIKIRGKGGHGAYPNLTIDPIQIAVQIYIALEALIAREADPEKACVLTVGQIQGGSAPNIIPDSAELAGTLRTNDKAQRKLLVERIKQVAEGISSTYGGTVEVESLSAVAPLVCEPDLTEQMVSYLKEMKLEGYGDISANASEDFANIAEKVPSTFIYLSAGFADERGDFSAHNPKVRFNEDVCPIGTTAYAYCALR